MRFFSSHIIAILAAILFPVFAKAREKARQSSCLSNIKQLDLGLLMYIQDYDECFPGRYVCATYPDSGGIRWFPYSVADGCCFGGQAWHHRIGSCTEEGAKDGPHNEGANIAFCDGHAKWYKIRAIPDEDDDAQEIWIRPR